MKFINTQMSKCISCTYDDERVVSGPIPGYEVALHNCDVMFVFEAPFISEIRSDRMGARSEFLRSMLEKYVPTLDLDRVWISYLMQCPIKYGKVKARNCAGTMFWQDLQALEPQLVVCFGTGCLEVIADRKGITGNHGLFLKGEGEPDFLFSVSPTLPILAGDDKGSDTLKMLHSLFATIGRIYTGESPDQEVKRDYRVIKDAGDLLYLEKYLMEEHDFYVFDYENYPLKPWYDEARVLSCAWTAEAGRSVGVLVDHPEAQWSQKEKLFLYNLIRKWAVSDVGKAAANAKHEILWTQSAFGVRLNNIMLDPICMDYLTDENRPHDVGSMSYRYTNLGGYDRGMKDYWFKQTEGLYKGKKVPDYRRCPGKELLQYNMTDTDVEFRSISQLLNIMDFDLMKVHESILIPSAYALAQVEQWGWNVDRSRIEELIDAYDEKLESYLEEMRKFPEFVRFEEDNDGINFDSYPQKLKLVYGYDTKTGEKFEDPLQRYFDFPVDDKYRTDSGNPSTAEEWRRANKGNPFVNVFDQYMSAWGIKKNFLNNLPEYLNNIDGRIHTDYNAAKVVSGRLSSTAPNVQNFPDDKEFWSIFVSRYDPGYMLKADYSQVELRILAALAGDKPMIRTFKQGRDIHEVTAMEAFSIPEDEWLKLDGETRHTYRQQGKRTNFAIANDRGAYHLAIDLTSFRRETTGDWTLEVSTGEAQEYIDAWYKPHKAILRWKTRELKKARELGYVETPIGYRRRAPDVNSMDKATRHAAERTLISFLMQNTAGALTLIAKIRIVEYLRQRKLKSVICGSIYDSIILDVPSEELDVVASAVRDIMCGLGDDYSFKVPLEVDLQYGKDGGHLEDWDGGVPF